MAFQQFQQQPALVNHTSPEVTPPSNKSRRKPNVGSLSIVNASLLDVLLRTTSRFPCLRSSSRHSTAPGKASLPSSRADQYRANKTGVRLRVNGGDRF